MTAGQRHFVEKDLAASRATRLVAAGFWQIAKTIVDVARPAIAGCCAGETCAAAAHVRSHLECFRCYDLQKPAATRRGRATGRQIFSTKCLCPDHLSARQVLMGPRHGSYRAPSCAK